MKIYFEKTNGNNLVIITDGETAKIFDAAPSGIYEGVDLCAEDAADRLRDKFQALEASGELNDFNDIYSPDEMPAEELAEELEMAELVYETQREEKMKVNFEQLKQLNYDDGKALLLSMGYVAGEVGTTESNVSEWAQDEYFRLYDDDGEEVDVVSWEIYGNGQDEEVEIVREGWSDSLRGC